MAKKITSYDGCDILLNIILIKSRLKNGKIRLWSLATTKDYPDPCRAVRERMLQKKYIESEKLLLNLSLVRLKQMDLGDLA